MILFIEVFLVQATIGQRIVRTANMCFEHHLTFTFKLGLVEKKILEGNLQGITELVPAQHLQKVSSKDHSNGIGSLKKTNRQQEPHKMY